ncbi:hypothetical protein HDU85_003395 [Gaertneriomyces sp. JEL0708]|nr:hypothetical protein HDU85_003395 [Gaertneriomyces sp. JEL0708]
MSTLLAQAQALASLSDSAKSKSGRGSAKKKKKSKKRRNEGKKGEMIKNDKGELVSAKEWALTQTLEATSKSLTQYRERMTGLVSANEGLQETCQQQEKDALDVISALHRENEKKELKIRELRQQMEQEAERAREEREKLREQYEGKLADVNTVLVERESQFVSMQQEFDVIKDFRRKRHELLKELEHLKLQLADTEGRHQDVVQRMERKFFEEKIRLQKDATKKISELATKAHKEAVANLKETTKEVFRQNIRMAEALRYHVEEEEEIGKTNHQLETINRKLLEEKDLHDFIVKEKILKGKLQDQEIRSLQKKIESMERTLSHIVREFEYEKDRLTQLTKRELDEVRKFAERLKESLQRKTQEMKHIKRLAQHILDQRTDLERFFMDALDHVRGELKKEREIERKRAKEEYNRRMRTITSKSLVLPALRTTNDGADPTANKLLRIDPQIPPPPADTSSKVDINELTWSDKEKILRLLFARMNGVSLVGKGGGAYGEVGEEEQSPDLDGVHGRYAFEGRDIGIDDDWRSDIGSVSVARSVGDRRDGGDSNRRPGFMWHSPTEERVGRPAQQGEAASFAQVGTVGMPIAT